MTGAERALRDGRLLHAAARSRSAPGRRWSATSTVIGQIIGAGNYDIGHIALGVNGGGIAALGVVGGRHKARGLHRRPDARG